MPSGITVQSQPASFMPCYNPHWWVATSTNVAQPNFKYTIYVTDLITATVSPAYQISQRIDTKCVFNSATYIQRFMTQICPDTLYGFQKNTGAIRGVKVNIGETYDVLGVATYTAGADNTYITWNGGLDFLDFQSYTYTDFVYPNLLTNNINPNYVYGTSTRFCNDEITFEGCRNYMNIIGTSTNDPYSMTIKGYNSAGTLLSTTVIDNPYAASVNYYERYLFADVGYKGLENMTAYITSGTSPIPVSTFDYYDVSIFDSLFVTIETKRIYVQCEPKYDVTNLVYLGEKGQWEAFNFSKLQELTSDKITTTMKVLPYSVVSNVYTYSKSSLTERVIATTTTDGVKLNSDWISESQSAYLKELWSSPIIYMDVDGSLVPVKIVNNSYQTKRKYNSPLIQISFDLKYTHSNTRQRG